MARERKARAAPRVPQLLEHSKRARLKQTRSLLRRLQSNLIAMERLAEEEQLRQSPRERTPQAQVELARQARVARQERLRQTRKPRAPGLERLLELRFALERMLEKQRRSRLRLGRLPRLQLALARLPGLVSPKQWAQEQAKRLAAERARWATRNSRQTRIAWAPRLTLGRPSKC